MNQPALRTEVSHLAELSNVVVQLETILLGKRRQIKLAVACLIANGHLLIEDVPGVGKTTLAQGLSATLGLPWNRLQFTSDLLPADVIGVSVFNTNTHNFEFKHGPVFTSVLLADEINRAPPKAQSALLEAMEERQISLDGETYKLDDEFFVIATQNPTDQLGTYPLPESQLDRFLVSIALGYPDSIEERTLLKTGDRRQSIQSLEPVAGPLQIKHWSECATRLHVSDTVIDYIQALLNASRLGDNGLSPRAGLSLVRLCKAFAYLNGQNHVTADDVQHVFPALAGHRLTGQVSSGVVAAQALLDSVTAP
ncbi:MAG: AAA family ATPase [Granulosicoccaceae bacterium]